MTEIYVGVITFMAIQFIMVTLITLTRKLVLPGGTVNVRINNDKSLLVDSGGKLLTTLAEQDIILPSACGGGGSCGQCKVVVKKGGGSILPTERSHVTLREANQGVRLACQVQVKHDMEIEVPPEMLETRKWECRVISNNNVATFIKELVLELPPGEEVDSRPAAISR